MKALNTMNNNEVAVAVAVQQGMQYDSTVLSVEELEDKAAIAAMCKVLFPIMQQGKDFYEEFPKAVSTLQMNEWIYDLQHRVYDGVQKMMSADMQEFIEECHKPTKEELEMQRKETFRLNSMFKTMVEHKEGYNAQMIDLSRIEENSSSMIAANLAHQLEKKGVWTQHLQDPKAKNYVYLDHNGNVVEDKSVAIMGVVLAGILPFINDWYPLDHIIYCEVFVKRYMRIVKLNQALVKCVHDDMAYYQAKLKGALMLCIEAGLLEQDERNYVKHTTKYLGSCISRKSIMQQNKLIDKDARRKERVKSRHNAMKDGTSKKVREALDFIESQAQCVNTWLLDALLAARDKATVVGAKSPTIFLENGHVLHGCEKLRGEPELYSEYFMDLRGRMYQFAHCGPNPQASDMAKALCYHTITAPVAKDSKQHKMFLNEFYNEIIGDALWAEEKFIRRTAANPVGALEYAFNNYKDADGNPALPFSKFFSYMDMCRTWVEFEDTGFGTSHLGFGPDAKCSGAQIFSILAGCKELGESCGLITGFTSKPKDPYQRSGDSVNKIAARVKSILRPMRSITRNEIKTPFMAIQYGGGVPALRYKKFEPTMEALGIDAENRDKFCSEVVIAGINDALGERIAGFIQGLREAVEKYCNEHDVDSFQYKHVDGFRVSKQGEAKVALTEKPFIVNYDVTKQGIIFGSIKEGTGWAVQSRTTGLLQRQNFIHYFPVHFVQGLDAVVARAIALEAKGLGLRGYSTIHDQFRTCLEDAPMLRSTAVPNAYKKTFVEKSPVAFLEEQMGITIQWGNPLEPRRQILTDEILYSEDAYYFE